jgi:hypothetical protein
VKYGDKMLKCGDEFSAAHGDIAEIRWALKLVSYEGDAPSDVMMPAKVAQPLFGSATVRGTEFDLDEEE